jgi:excisionase family DNA binding protein
MSTTAAEYLSPGDVAEQLGVGVDRVYRWIAAGELAAINLNDGPRHKPRWLIRAAQLEAFLAARTTRATTPPPQMRRPRKPEHVIEFY